MIVCICNNFNEQAVNDYFDKQSGKKIDNFLDVYNACSNNTPPQCGTCVKTVLKDMIDAHNAALV